MKTVAIATSSLYVLMIVLLIAGGDNPPRSYVRFADALGWGIAAGGIASHRSNA